MTSLPSRLDEYDRNEWRDIMRRLRPDMADADFDRAWDEFQRLKAQKALQ